VEALLKDKSEPPLKLITGLDEGIHLSMSEKCYKDDKMQMECVMVGSTELDLQDKARDDEGKKMDLESDRLDSENTGFPIPEMHNDDIEGFVEEDLMEHNQVLE
jgi:hypothetical protein